MGRINAVAPAPTFTQQGFSLVEMAVVLVILALLIGGMLLPMSAQRDLKLTADTAQQLENAREALLGFMVINGRLPCPAPATLATGAVGAGQEAAPVVTTGCATLAGVLPWATLGIGETDAWGNRFTYRITQEFTRTPPQTTFSGTYCPTNTELAGFAICSPGDMTVRSTAGGGTLASNVAAVLISHGKNGNGAYTSLGTQTAIGNDLDEIDNQLISGGTATANTDFVGKTITDSFDDLIIWLPTNTIISRMVAAGRLP